MKIIVFYVSQQTKSKKKVIKTRAVSLKIKFDSIETDLFYQTTLFSIHIIIVFK